ncbi:MAG TPA: peptidoglycan-binding domain-containing protein [Kofleriaceae bacterium]|nr:peptidoglycan-binding domain-containing protein [Kofleriaceae bacterium]
MSKEQVTEQQPGQEGAAPTAEVAEETYGLPPQIVAQIKQLSPADDAGLAALLQSYPSHMGKILPLAAKYLGNMAVRRAMDLVKKWTAKTAGGSQSQEEIHANLASPADATAVKEHEVASFMEDKSDPQAPDETPSKPEAKPEAAPAAEPAWVADARRYNDVQEYLVEEFNELTAYVCLNDDTGKLDPKAVADWQRAHGLAADGKVGPHTVQAARAASAKGPQVAKTEQPEARIPV